MSASYVVRAREALLDELDETHQVDGLMLATYALLVITRGRGCTLVNVHDAWAIATAPHRPDHPCLVPFRELSADKQVLDVPYRDAIVRAAGRLEAEGVL